MEIGQDKSVPELPVSGYDFARTIIEQRGDAAIDILLEAAHVAETDWLEKKAAVYPSEAADPSYKSLLEKLEKAPPETRRRERDLYENKLLREIACAVVALHNSRGGVVLVGIDDDNKPVPLMADADHANLPQNGPEVESFVRMEVLGRLCPEGEVFVCKGGNWRIPVGKTGVYPKLCRFHESSVVALLVPPLGRGKAPLVVTITENNKSRDSVLLRMPGDVGQTQKGTYEDRWVGTEAQKADFLQNRDNRFLSREDLSVKLRDLGLSVSHLPVIRSIEAPAKKIFSSVNQPRAKNFVGREKELAELHSLLQKGRIPIVTGAGGTGKSELVFQYAEQHKTDYPGGLFQIDMETVTSWDAAFYQLSSSSLPNGVSLRELLQLGKTQLPENAEDVLRALMRRSETIGDILLVLDNVESARTFFRQPVLDKLALPSAIHMVATARSSDIILRKTDIAAEFPLLDLSQEEALELLLHDKSADSDDERKAAADIALLLDCHPLYLRAVPALLDDPYSPLAGSYASLEKSLRDSLQETVEAAVEDYGEGERTPSALWSLTRAHLSRYPLGAAWVKLAYIASFFSADGFRKAILRHLWGTLAAPDSDTDVAFEQGLDVLRRHGLLADAGSGLRMHRLTAAALRRSARENDVGLEDSIGNVLSSFDGTSSRDWLSLADSIVILRHIPQQVLLDKLPTDIDFLSFQCRIMLKNQGVEDLIAWESLTSHEWSVLLKERPMLANHCSWDNLDGDTWALILKELPQFADRCPWDKLDGNDWAWLLRKRPQFADRCPWDKLDGNNWAWLLGSMPQFGKHCPWDSLDGTWWANILITQPQFADNCPWGKLDGFNWACLLSSQPQFAERCPWNKLDKFWGILLARQPQFVDRCLQEEPNGTGWSRVLGCRPQLADRCPWEELDGENWSYLLQKQPQFADRCPWDKMTGFDWARLLSVQPQLAHRCPWEKLDEEDWRLVNEMQPQLASFHPHEKREAAQSKQWISLYDSEIGFGSVIPMPSCLKSSDDRRHATSDLTDGNLP